MHLLSDLPQRQQSEYSELIMHRTSPIIITQHNFDSSPFTMKTAKMRRNRDLRQKLEKPLRFLLNTFGKQVLTDEINSLLSKIRSWSKANWLFSFWQLNTQLHFEGASILAVGVSSSERGSRRTGERPKGEVSWFGTFSGIIKWKNIVQIIILLRKPFSMPQYARQSLSELPQTAKREFHSLKYREANPNTPSHSHAVPPIALPTLKKNRKESEKQSDSFQTCESEGSGSSERGAGWGCRESKIKVELCKNFVEKGYCPYENRCRFAHGVEELRAKDTWGNSELYRTRRCKVFFEKHECKFGERCNFMHEHRKLDDILHSHARAVREAIRINFEDIGLEAYAARVHSSKLLSLLGTPNI